MSASTDRVTPPARTPRPPVDASMRLLLEVMEHPLDPAYAHAARARAMGERPRRPLIVIVALLAVLCGWAASQAVVELRRPEPGQDTGRQRLEQEIARRTATADARQHELEQLRAQIAAAQQRQLTSQGDAEVAAQAQQLGVLAGELPVTGPGLEFSIDNARPADSQSAAVDPRAASGADDGRVLDHDLQSVVNGLWAAGAEAIAINGRRLTSLSAIRSAGQAILVDFRAVVPPYVIQAVGDPSSLQTSFSGTKAAQELQSLRDNFGVQVSITSSQNLRLPAAGAFQLRVGTPVPSGEASGAASGSGSSSGSTSGSSSGASSAPGQAGSPASVSTRPSGTARPGGTTSSTEVTP